MTMCSLAKDNMRNSRKTEHQLIKIVKQEAKRLHKTLKGEYDTADSDTERQYWAGFIEGVSTLEQNILTSLDKHSLRYDSSVSTKIEREN